MARKGGVSRGGNKRRRKRVSGITGVGQRIDGTREYDLDTVFELKGIYEDLGPRLGEMLRVKDWQGMFEELTPAAIISLARIMRYSRNDKEKRAAATELLYMSLGKPVQRSMSVYANVGRMSEAQLDSVLRSQFKKLPAKYQKAIEENFPKASEGKDAHGSK